MNNKNDEITLKNLFDIFLPKLWLIALIAILFAGIVGGYSFFFKEDQYTSNASFIMVKVPTQYSDSSTTTALNTGLNANEIEAMQAMIGMSDKVMKSNEFMSDIKARLVARDLRYETVSLAQLKGMITIKVVGDATCFDITTTSTDPKLAFDLNEVVYEKLPGVIESVFDSYAIRVKVIDPPVESSTPVAKNTVRNTVLGFAVGAVFAAVVVFIISRLDVVIRSRENIEKSFDIPILGVIPRLEDEE